MAQGNDSRSRFNRGEFRERFRIKRRGFFRPAWWDEFLSAVANGIQQAQVVSIAGGTLRVGPGGTALGVTPGVGGTAAATTHPYQGSDASVASTPKVTILYGTHASIPPLINGVPINANPADNILTLDGSPSGIVYVQVDFNTSGTVLATSSINSSDSGTPPANVVNSDGSGTGYQTLFAWYVTYDAMSNATVTVADNVLGSQSCSICGSGIQFWQAG
jgi:hypothetical protein